MITLEELEEETKMPTPEWAGNCYAVACAASDMIGGSEAIYGHWTGPVAEGSRFSNRGLIGFVQHGWVLLKDGHILDPTRWVFENVKPYLYIGPNDHYDEGGNHFRMAIRNSPPPWDPLDNVYEVTREILPPEPWRFVEKLLKLDEIMAKDYTPGDVTFAQLHWLANYDPQQMEGHAEAIYEMLTHFHMEAHIPFDNRNMVERGRA